jgi:hypothetical protein
VLLIRVIELLQAGGALGSVGVFKAAVETVVTHAIAIAITRLLMKNLRDLRREFVSVGLVRILGVSAPKVGFGQNRG